MTTMLEEAVTHIKTGNIERARPLLIEFLKQNPQSEDAWLWMSRCVTEPEQKRYCFEKVLKLNPQNQHAIKGLSRLDNPVVAEPQSRAPIALQKPSSLSEQPIKTDGQTLPKSTSKRNNSIIIVAVLGLLGVICLCVTGLSMLDLGGNSNNLTQQNNPIPTQITRPNYRQMLENYGFVYTMNNEYGDPVYVTPCGCVATINSEYMGFAVYVEDNDCATQDLGAIISVMYPSEVFDFVINNMHAVIVEDTLVQGRAGGHNISIDFDPIEYNVAVIIRH